VLSSKSHQHHVQFVLLLIHWSSWWVLLSARCLTVERLQHHESQATCHPSACYLVT
jgi:hypothetical protein